MPIITCSCCNATSVQEADIDICTSCIKFGVDDTKILAIKKYLEKHPKATLKAVAATLKISISDINRFIDEGILIIVENEKGEISVDSPLKNDSKEKRRAELIKNLSDAYNSTAHTTSIKNNTNSRLVSDLRHKYNKEER